MSKSRRPLFVPDKNPCMSWERLKVKKNQEFGDLRVIGFDQDKLGWLYCICWCANGRRVHQDKLLHDLKDEEKKGSKKRTLLRGG